MSRETPQQLLTDLRALVTDVEKMVSESVSEPAEDAVEALRGEFHAAQERVAEFYASARERVIAGARSTDEIIRAHPYQAMAVAAGTGLIVGILVGRRRR